MTRAIVIGDGPAGLSAALFLSKNGVDTVVFAQDKTANHYALLRNYLGIPEITGTAFQQIARQQAASFGAEIRDQMVTGVAQTENGFTVTSDDGAAHEADYVLLAEGKGSKLAVAFGLQKGDSGIPVDRDGRSGVDGLYVVGRSTRVTRSQAIISAGEGAAAALDILSRLYGKEFNDFDTPPKETQ